MSILVRWQQSACISLIFPLDKMAAISLSIHFHSQRLLKKQTFHNDNKNDNDDDEVAIL